MFQPLPAHLQQVFRNHLQLLLVIDIARSGPKQFICYFSIFPQIKKARRSISSINFGTYLYFSGWTSSIYGVDMHRDELAREEGRRVEGQYAEAEPQSNGYSHQAATGVSR